MRRPTSQIGRRSVPIGVGTMPGNTAEGTIAMPRKKIAQTKDRNSTIAAAYARFSSDRQREESIEIQLEAIRKYCEGHDLTLGPVYKDLAMSGTNDRRPDFQRCLRDAERGLFGTLVIYKQDRFARNVEDSKRNMRRLRAAGVRVVSVREGELEDTPDGFLRESIGEIFAEYYSRNLSVLVKDGMRKSAEQLRTVGVRIYGYSVDESDHFVIDPEQSFYVSEIFRLYLAGTSGNEICAWLNSEGQRTLRGNRWDVRTLSNLLGQRAYMGVYHFGDIEVEGGMPAIISKETFAAVQELRKRRQSMKRCKQVNDYVLTDKCYCLDCGRAMCGTAGTSSSGKKYTYYGCMNKGGCRKRVSSQLVEDAVIDAIVEVLQDDEAKDAIVADMLEWSAMQPQMAEEWREQIQADKKRRDRLVAAVADGLPASSVMDAMKEIEDEIAALEAKVAREEAEMSATMDAESARAFLDSFLLGSRENVEYRKLLADSFIDKVFIDKRNAVVIFNLGLADEEQGYTLEDIQGIRDDLEFARRKCAYMKTCEPADKSGVRTSAIWWAKIRSLRTLKLYSRARTYAIGLPLAA